MTVQSPDMTVTILGSGTCVPSLRRSASAVLLETENTRMLFDCGPGTMHRLLEAGTEIFDISVLFLSHFHPDHSGELVPFLFANKYPDGKRRREPLTLIGGNGITAFFEGLKGAYGHWIELPPDLFSIVAADNQGPDHMAAGELTIATAPMAHNPESVACRVTGPGGASVVCSGDTGFSEHLIALARGADLLICESALPDRLGVPGHLTPSQAGEMATQAGVRKLVLTHFYPECDNADLVSECRKTYKGPLVLAADLMRMEVNPA